ncbi:DUF5694 domain-containing protein [Fulvivirga sp.]|uniref:DUF5694 domain-containing protein n=1 Tax=Fulvivirga sp. TaxID=1931237 RepID=UPI0032ED9F33
MEVVERIAAFNATIVCIENPIERQPEVDSLYASYFLGDHDLSISEYQQLGFRITKMCQAKIHTVEFRDTKNQGINYDLRGSLRLVQTCKIWIICHQTT